MGSSSTGFGKSFPGNGGGGGIPGPPFALSSGANGLSVDPITKKLVLGNSVGGGNVGKLLDNREIFMNNFSLQLLTASAQDLLLFKVQAETPNPFKFIVESGPSGTVGETNNPVKWGWNIGANTDNTHSSEWFSMEPNFRPGGARLKEVHLQLQLPAPSNETSRLWSSTFTEGATMAASTNLWYMSGTSLEFRNLLGTQTWLLVNEGSAQIGPGTVGDVQFGLASNTNTAIFQLVSGSTTLALGGAGLRVVHATGIRSVNQNGAQEANILCENNTGNVAGMFFFGSASADVKAQSGLLLISLSGFNDKNILFNKTSQILFGNYTTGTTTTSDFQFYGSVSIQTLQNFASNALALLGGLVAGDLYRTAGAVMVVI